MRNRASGFTIVELLIVIVVIAILAAVSASAYQGVRQRAANTSVASSLNTIEKFLRLYETQNGKQFKIDSADAVAAGIGAEGTYYYLIAERAGVCIGKQWPDSVLSQGTEQLWDYCNSNPNNSGVNRGVATDLFNKAVQKAGTLASSLPDMPSIDPIPLHPTGKANPILQRGIRLANIDTQNISYLFYPLYGKTCLTGDRTVNFEDTQWIDYYGHNGFMLESSSLDGDFTVNDTVYCVRTMSW